MQKIYEIDPFPAVRSNKNSWSKRVQEYHAKMNHLRLLIGDDKQQIIDSLIDGYYILTFIIPMPTSWSKKKREEMDGTHHQQTPDTDNLYKAFTDTVFYKRNENDSHIWDLGGRKFWGKKGQIIFEK